MLPQQKKLQMIPPKVVKTFKKTEWVTSFEMEGNDQADAVAVKFEQPNSVSASILKYRRLVLAIQMRLLTI